MYGVDRKICHSGSLFGITRQASWCRSMTLVTHFSIHSIHPWKILIIFHGCRPMVWIEKSVTRVTDRHHEACRVMPNSDPEWQIYLSIPYTHDRHLLLHTFWFTTFDFQSRTWYEITLFPLKGFYLSWKKSTLPATAVRFFTFTSNLHKVTTYFDVTAVKTNVTWRRRYVTSYTINALHTRDFCPVLGEITWVR